MPKVKKKKAGAARTAGGAKTAGGWVNPVTRVRDWWADMPKGAIAGAYAVTGVGLALVWATGGFNFIGVQANRAAAAGAQQAGLEIRRITVRGLDQTAGDDLLAAVGPVIGESILHFDPYRAKARVEDLGWVRSAAVSRLLPDTIHVSVRERAPAAVWQLNGALRLIDDSGAVIADVGVNDYTGLPFIVGPGAPDSASEMLAVVKSYPDIAARTAAIVRVGDRRWTLTTKSKTDVKLPEKDFAAAVKDLADLQAAFGLLDDDLEYLDLRDPERFVYRKRGEAEDAPVENR